MNFNIGCYKIIILTLNFKIHKQKLSNIINKLNFRLWIFLSLKNCFLLYVPYKSDYFT
jgi:hypothetical protein